MRDKIKIAIAAGDPAGVGPEISLKTALDPDVRARCSPIIFGNPDLLLRHAKMCGISVELHIVDSMADAEWSDTRVNVLNCRMPDPAPVPLGAVSAAAGRASIAFCARAIEAARAGAVDAVVAAPQNETSIAMAGIKFDGHPAFVAQRTDIDEDDVYLMLCFGDMKIAHATLHRSVREAIAMITPDNIARVIRTTHRALRRLGLEKPKICVSGLNPHAGEDGLFGREEIEIIKPAIDAAAAEGIAVAGPVGADIMFHKKGFDAFIVMLHDQGHIPAKLLAENSTAAMTIGTLILFSSVAHGSAHDIAGKGVANPKAMIEAIKLLTKTIGAPIAK